MTAEPFSSQKRWIVIYPSYIDKKKTTKQGRKIAQKLAIENPTSVEIHDVLAAVGFNPLLEREKCFPREGDREPEVQGRVRVQLKNDDGTPKFEQKKSMLIGFLMGGVIHFMHFAFFFVQIFLIHFMRKTTFAAFDEIQFSA
uniref:Signal recognition particle 19 kDa protein n=1 Tax=Caenorhabditis japonica TaxID=281687 RepID=A0A8R1HZH9_CAEJA